MMKGKHFLQRSFSVGDATRTMAWNASDSGAGYLTHQEAQAILGELLETDGNGRFLPAMSTYISCPQRIYVTLATCLPAGYQGLSCAGLCYIQFLEDSGGNGCMRLAALPSHLESDSPRKSMCGTLGEEQLRMLLPWDRTLQRLETCCVRDVLWEYISCFSDQEPPAQVSLLGTPSQEDVSDEVWVALPEMFVSATTAQTIAKEVKRPSPETEAQHYPARLFWLKTMIAMLERQLFHAGVTILRKPYTKLLSLVERLIRLFKGRDVLADRRFMVRARILRRGQHCLGWYLIVGVPQSTLRTWGF